MPERPKRFGTKLRISERYAEGGLDDLPGARPGPEAAKPSRAGPAAPKSGVVPARLEPMALPPEAAGPAPRPKAPRGREIKVRIAIARDQAERLARIADDAGLPIRHIVLGLAPRLRIALAAVLVEGPLPEPADCPQETSVAVPCSLTLTAPQIDALAARFDPVGLYPRAVTSALTRLASHLMRGIIAEFLES
ncbi:MAG: hypothetical protein AAF565_18830, partial [Pseudomonadota bacterium]